MTGVIHSNIKELLPGRIGLYCLILLFIFQMGCGISQHDSTDQIARINGRYLVSYWDDTKTIVREPFHWKAKQWSRLAGVVGIGLVTYVYDQEIYDFFQTNRSTTADNLSKYVIEPWGSGVYSIPFLAGLYLSGSKTSRHRHIALTGFKAFVLTAGATAVVKHLTHRHRPGDDNPPDPRKWDGPFPLTLEYTAFPSGHTSTAFAIASVLAIGYRDKWWVGVSAYSIAGLVGISRLYDRKHWGSDVVAGAALGTFIGVTLSKVNLKGLSVIPITTAGVQGVQLRYTLR
jgi:membrane-associated phospholipid phosphatase